MTRLYEHMTVHGCGSVDDPLEGAQVDLAQRALVDVGGDPHAVGLLVVGGEVLERRADALALQAAHERRAEDAGDERVLGEVLEVAAAQRRALDVDAGAEQHGDVLRRGLLAERHADALEQLGVPGRAERHGRREAGRRHAVGESEVVAASRCLRTPCGPSVSMISGMPARGRPVVSQKLPPLVSDGLLLEGQPRDDSLRALGEHRLEVCGGGG